MISPINGTDFAIPVTGDSMSPEYPSGSKVLVAKINDKAFIDWGRTYVLDTCNGTVIKKVYPSENDGYIKCVSVNPNFPTFEINVNDIYGWYRVLMSLSLK
jgi:phage repressor protein C with HTH and peptisase S24 domain